VAEGRRLVRAAAADGLTLRLLGGVAVALRVPAGIARTPGDIDLITAAGAGGHAVVLLRREGYEPHVAFNALHGTERLLFHDPAHDRRVDVFVGDFRMCHRIPLGERLALEPETIPPAELLLTKLQAVAFEAKDRDDVRALLAAGEVTGAEADRVAALCARDWGLWRTVTANLATCGDTALRARIDAAPKSRRWRARALIGERRRWYAVPEEPAGWS
jgi:hypothetical protein